MRALTVIRGLSIAAENRLRRAGITSCSQLAETSSEEIRQILGYLAQGSNVERWIAQAQAFAHEHAL